MFIDKSDKMSLRTKKGESVTIRFEINPKAKRLILRIDEKTREAVAVAPSKRHLKEAAAFAESRLDWLAMQLSALPREVRLMEGAQFDYRGQPCLISGEGLGRRAYISDVDPLTLHAPGLPETLSSRVLRFLKADAKAHLTHAVEAYCDRLGVAARRVTVKDTRSRWGSCTSDGRLAFSWRLIMAPPPVLEYVAAHECAHLLEMNHSAAFWAHVARCRPAYKAERNWLRRNGRQLHAVTAD
ncbi:MAG: SprT family zinc-dependent metalloprotease [Pseudomonadota bacterium]